MRLFQRPKLASLRINPDVLSDGKQSTVEFEVQGWGFIWARLATKRRSHERVLQIVGWFLPQFVARFIHALIWPLSFFNEKDLKWIPIKKFCAFSNRSNQISVPFGELLEVNVFNIFGNYHQTISVPIPVENVPALKIDSRQYQLRKKVSPSLNVAVLWHGYGSESNAAKHGKTLRSDLKLSGNISPLVHIRISVTQFSESLSLPKARFSQAEIQPYNLQPSNDRT
jgi:hypothetical protein